MQYSLHRLGYPNYYPNVEFIELFDSPGRGFGLRSLKKIPRGAPILLEQQIFSIEADSALNREMANDADFLRLSCAGQSQTSTDRFNQNAFQMGRTKSGLFLTASRFNHSCVPNAHFSWNWRSKRLTFHAMKDIPAGTEIFINYYRDDYLKTVLERQQELNSAYHFTCSCKACDPNSDFHVESEERRSQMRELDEKIKDNKELTLPRERY